MLGALWNLSSGDPAVGVPVANIDEAIGRGRDEHAHAAEPAVAER